jgi:hypothetical protein
MSRNESSVTMTEMRGHDAEIGGHDAPKYAVDHMPTSGLLRFDRQPT